MTRLAMPISICARSALVLTGAALLTIAPPALAQVVDPEPNAEDVARTPLSDLNIDKREIPEVLTRAVADPYSSEGLKKCDAIVVAIAEIDTVLGNDYDIAGSEKTDRLSEGKIAQGLVGSLIPFRGIVREVSGAAGGERKWRAAATAGMVRRGYLKGLGEARGCKYPARPREREMFEDAPSAEGKPPKTK